MNISKTIHNSKRRLLAGRTLLVVLPVAAILVTTFALVSPFGGKKDYSSIATYTVRRHDLDITVLESGQVAALRQQEIKSQVEGTAEILSIADEGIIITQEDIDNSLVLVELDTTEVRDRLAQQEITLQSATASFTQAKESYDIQVKQNESNIKAGELRTRFSRMDFNRYIGDELAVELLEKHTSLNVSGKPLFDYAAIIEDERLGGEAMQRIRKLRSDIDHAGEEITRAAEKLQWTERLFKREFVSQNEYQADQLALKRRQVDLEQAEIALDLFIRYEFPKQVEQRLSDYHEAARELERIKARSRSELAKAEANLMSSRATHRVQDERYNRLQRMIDASVIHATQPGMVVYASSLDPNRPPLEKGSSIRFDQLIIALPDTHAMGAEIKVHEAAVERVRQAIRKGTVRARVTIDAFSDKSFEGIVQRPAYMPDRQHRWMNPDLRVYSTKVEIHGNHPELQPGLSCQVEILLDRLPNVLVVPLQSVVPRGNHRVAYVLTPNGPVPRLVVTGAANDSFMEIREGLREGERVLLNPPRFASNGELADDEDHGPAVEAAPDEPIIMPDADETPAEQPVDEEPREERRRRQRDPMQLLEQIPAEERDQLMQRLEGMSQEERRDEMRRLMQQHQPQGGAPQPEN